MKNRKLGKRDLNRKVIDIKRNDKTFDGKATVLVLGNGHGFKISIKVFEELAHIFLRFELT